MSENWAEGNQNPAPNQEEPGMIPMTQNPAPMQDEQFCYACGYGYGPLWEAGDRPIFQLECPACEWPIRSAIKCM